MPTFNSNFNQVHTFDGPVTVRSIPMPDPLSSQDLLTYRLRCNLTLKEVSERTGLSAATIHRIENGTTRATKRSRVMIADGLGLDQAELDRLLKGSWSSNNLEDREGI